MGKFEVMYRKGGSMVLTYNMGDGAFMTVASIEDMGLGRGDVVSLAPMSMTKEEVGELLDHLLAFVNTGHFVEATDAFRRAGYFHPLASYGQLGGRRAMVDEAWDDMGTPVD